MRISRGMNTQTRNKLEWPNIYWEGLVTWNDCESMPVEKVAITIAHIAMRKLWKQENGRTNLLSDQENQLDKVTNRFVA